MLLPNQIDALVHKLVLGYQPDKVILFGSYAYGTPTEDSDLDLLVIKDDQRPHSERYFEARGHIGRKPGAAIDVIVLTPNEFIEKSVPWNGMLKEIREKGKIVYEKQRGVD